MANLFRSCHALAKHGRPYTDFKWICKLEKSNGLDLGNSYVSDKQATNFTHFIAQVHCNITREKILFAKFISIMCDGSIDSSITEQEIVGLYVRIVVCEKPETYPIGIVRASAERITEAVVNSFN